MKFCKPPLAVPAQLELLKRRGMVVADEARAVRVLQNINYYRLRAYWLPFEAHELSKAVQDEHLFKPGTDFDTVVSLYVFDRKLRLLLLEAIERVEIAIRTHWAQMLADKYGAHAYLNRDVFYNLSMHGTCLSSLDEELERSKETFVQHYREKYTQPARPPHLGHLRIAHAGAVVKMAGQYQAQK